MHVMYIEFNLICNAGYVVVAVFSVGHRANELHMHICL